jgi:NAD(P)-dependent dehydrogenase (short-subunit alcohol dehydrogenase family)
MELARCRRAGGRPAPETPECIADACPRHGHPSRETSSPTSQAYTVGGQPPRRLYTLVVRPHTRGGTDVRFDFTNKTVVVFGGTTGINLAIAEAFAGAGARVAVASRRPDNVEAAVVRIKQSGGEARGFVADVRDFDSVAAAFAGVRASGAPSMCLSLAPQVTSLLKSIRCRPTVLRLWKTSISSAPLMSCEPGLSTCPRGASVLNITAPQATIPMRYQAHVCAAKARVDQLTRVLALEWGRRGIRVNAIAPGPISGTEGLGRLTPTDDPGGDTAVKMVPLGRLGTKQDIASLAMFLSSSAASYISGAVIPRDGGGAIDSVKSGIEEAGRSLAATSKTDS